MKTKLVLFFVTIAVGCGGGGLLFGKAREILFPIALICLAVAFVIEKLVLRKQRVDIDRMKPVDEDWVTINIPGHELIITDRWDLSYGLRIRKVPAELNVRLHLLQDSNYMLIESVELNGVQKDNDCGNSTVIVDSGFLYFGDAILFNEGLSRKELESLILKSYDKIGENGPLRVIVTDLQGRCRGVVCSTGIGDGEFQVNWTTENGNWHLQTRFL